MRTAMYEMDRRRQVQLKFNETHNITPKGISKRIKDIIDGVYDKETAQREQKAAQDLAYYENMSEKQVIKEMKRIEKAMHEAAKNLEFEKAADYRDQLKQFKTLIYGADISD